MKKLSLLQIHWACVVKFLFTLWTSTSRILNAPNIEWKRARSKLNPLHILLNNKNCGRNMLPKWLRNNDFLSVISIHYEQWMCKIAQIIINTPLLFTERSRVRGTLIMLRYTYSINSQRMWKENTALEVLTVDGTIILI